MNLFDLSLRINGFPIDRARAHLADIQSIPEDGFEGYVTGQREEIARFHFENNNIYRGLVGDRFPSSWEELPVMTKAHLQQPLENRLSKGFRKKDVYVNKTSGSSGHPFIFAKDRFCHALTWAEITDRFGWYGLDFHKTLQARFYGIPLESLNYWKERIKDLLSARYRFPIFDLSEEKLAGFLEVFRKKKFVFINGYTSSIVLFARYIRSQGLVLREVCPTLRYCVVTSEMLFEDDRKLMEDTFGVPVVNEYGASELDLIAFEDKRGDFVVNSETLHVEVVDEDARPVQKGHPGRILITALYNKAHPMVRYDIGDTGILHPKSNWKRPVLQELTGRTNDVAVLPGGKTVPGLTFYYVTKSVISQKGFVREFVVEQTSPADFTIRYVADRELDAKEMAGIADALKRYVGDGLQLSFDRKAVLERSTRGKLKQFVSSIRQ